MKLIDIITKLLAQAGLEASDMVSLLEHIVESVPDLAPQAQRILDALHSATSPAVQAEVAIAIIKELGPLAQLKFDGRTHAGDGA